MAAIVAQEEQPISRTYQYRKVMKPMLERKRRARINRCLDELKELLVGALQAEGESVSRLEKADVLELTVRHLHKLRRVQQMNETSASERFRAGFVHCANEVSAYMGSASSVCPNPGDMTATTSRLMAHLDNCIQRIDTSSGVAAAAAGVQIAPSLTFGQHGQHSPSGLNILTNYTPPTSPVSSPQFAGFLKQEGSVHSHSHSMSPSPAHLQSQSPFGQLVNHCRPSPVDMKMPLQTMDEPFDLSNNVWRPW